MRLDKLAQINAPGRNQRWFLISAAIHVVAIAGLIMLIRPFRPVRTVSYIDLGPPEAAMPQYQGPGGRGAETHPRGAARPREEAPTPPREVADLPAAPTTVPQGVNPEVNPDDSLPIDTHRQLGPEYGDGRLWVNVGDAVEGKLPARVAVDSMPAHVAKVDSALASKIRTYLDTVPPDSFATRAAPKWTTEIAGKTWGIDGKWIYLGGVKIPTALLALLPIPAEAGGNYDGQQREGKINAMRRDIMESAERAANAVEFNRYVKELRQRKEMEHRAREEPPPPPPPPPPIVVTDTTKRQPLIP